jgi:hypothetical protein
MSEAVDLLRAIDKKLAAMLAVLSSAPSTPSHAGATIASDRDLDSRYGDPEVRFDPRDWIGPSFKGCHYSECPADYLDLVAEAKDYFARKAREENKLTAKGKPVADYEANDAARARGWAARIRAGKHTPPPPQPAPVWASGEEVAPDVDDIPFMWLLPLVLPALAASMVVLA